MIVTIFDISDTSLGKGSKIKLIIFAEFSAKGVPPPPTPPSRKIINFFFQKIFIGLKWCTCCEMDSVWYGKFIWVFLGARAPLEIAHVKKKKKRKSFQIAITWSLLFLLAP